ncbi:hypothetical protein [Actinacidiphila bryophytorum]|uniref:hypothetical protein n=1 Tax=Actinacidiphila bryophytorum TaxID=1436133 RepID=UPI0021769FC5|nr:hypothetical protein [Actinacidiphila bryophytorum]UWE13465.1 hypothetical protein NYE86_35550 [Actinacidiphila bryophytorum]
MNTEGFEDRLMHELKNHVLQNAQHVNADETGGARPVRSSPVRWVPLGLVAGLAAAVAVTTLVVGQSASPGAPGALTASADGGRSLTRITNAAYTLEKDPAGGVRLTIENQAGKPDIEAMRNDLARMGVRAKVLAGDPNCPAGGASGDSGGSIPAQSNEHTGEVAPYFHLRRASGKLIAYIYPAKVPAGSTLTLGFPFAEVRPDHALDVLVISAPKGNGPTCIPAGTEDDIRHEPTTVR